jgi:uncharacterized protein
MQTYFVDAWLLVALVDRLDQHHLAAQRIQAALRRAPLVTHDGVLTEVAAYYSATGEWLRARAVDVIRATMRNAAVFPADRLLFLAGLDLYSQRRDKQYSLVDCMSMMLMRAHGTTHVLTNDHHFRQEGFTVLSDAP